MGLAEFILAFLTTPPAIAISVIGSIGCVVKVVVGAVNAENIRDAILKRELAELEERRKLIEAKSARLQALQNLEWHRTERIKVEWERYYAHQKAIPRASPNKIIFTDRNKIEPEGGTVE